MNNIFGEDLEFDLGSGTVVIVPTGESPVSSVNGRVGNVVLDWKDVKAASLLSEAKIVWESGGLYEATGIEFSDAATARTGFLPVVPGGVYVIAKDAAAQSLPFSVFEYTSNAVTTAQDSSFVKRTMFSDTATRFVPDETTKYIRIRVNTPVSAVDGRIHVLTGAAYAARGKRTYETLSEMLRDNSLVPGVQAETLGFSAKGDFGGGTYEIVSGVTANDCTVFALANGYFAQRVFTEKWAYLESLNVQNVSFDTINALLLAAGVKNVRCGILTLDKPVILGSYDFDFDELTYTGTGYAIEIKGVSQKHIRGNRISAPNGSGIYVTDAPYNTLRNKIEVREILADDTGILANPCHGKGIMHNIYEIGRIESHRRGYASYIPAGTGKYSWQGEEYLSFGEIRCSRLSETDPPGIAVSLVVDPKGTGSNEYSEDGTITGLTFAHLSVEYSDIGVLISAGRMGLTPGGTSPVPNQEPGIKSIVINNMRCREHTRTERFLKAFGYLKDIYIKPTSAVQLCQWQITNTARDVGCFIDAPVYEHNPYVTIGSGIRSVRGITYVEKGAHHPLVITGDTDFAVLGRRALYAGTQIAKPDDGKMYFSFPETSDSEWHRTKSDNDAYVSYTYDGTTWTPAVPLAGELPANSGLFITDYFMLDASRAGMTTNVNMAYYYKESASDLMFRLPAATSADTVLVLAFNDINAGGTAVPLTYTVTLTNPDTQAAHLYSVSVLTNFSTMKDTAIVRDLGAVT